MDEATMISIGKRLVLGVVMLFAITQGLSWYMDYSFQKSTGISIQELAR